MDTTEKKQLIGGFFWKFAERISSQGVTFILSIILARLLAPSEYGTIAMVQIFVAIANVFIISGFATSLIQNKDADDLDFSTNLYCSMTLSVILYIAIFIFAPAIASFYKMPELVLIIRVYGISLIICGYSSIQNAWVSRHMLFKKFFYTTFVGTLLSGLVGIFMAYKGWGVWSLVAQTMSCSILNCLILRCIIDWRPKLIFSWSRAKKMMSYGSKILLADIIGTIFNQLKQLLIGKMYTPADLALFNRGNQYPNLITTNIDSSLGTVLFPAMSNHSDDSITIKRMTRKAITISSYLMFFCMTLLAAVGYPLIELMLTEKWVECVPYMQMVCLGSMISTVSTANIQAIKAIGRSDMLLKLEIYKKPVFFISLVISAYISVYAVAITIPLYAFYSAYINMRPNSDILNYSIKEQLIDLLPASCFSIIMFVVVYPISLLGLSSTLSLLIQIPLGIVIYILLSKTTKCEAYILCKNIVYEIKNKK